MDTRLTVVICTWVLVYFLCKQEELLTPNLPSLASLLVPCSVAEVVRVLLLLLFKRRTRRDNQTIYLLITLTVVRTYRRRPIRGCSFRPPDESTTATPKLCRYYHTTVLYCTTVVLQTVVLVPLISPMVSQFITHEDGGSCDSVTGRRCH